MTDFVFLLQAAIGAMVIFALRNDTVEVIVGIGFRRAPWIIFAVALAACGVANNGIEWWRIAIVALLAGWLWSDGHPWILQGPGQRFGGNGLAGTRASKYTDAALAVSRRGKSDGQVMGFGVWLTASALRYVVPCCAVAVAADTPWPMLAGLAIVAGYWPVAWWIAERIGGDTRFIGAAIAGAVFYGSL